METGNGKWKWKSGQKTHQSLMQCFLHSVYSHYSCTVLCDYVASSCSCSVWSKLYGFIPRPYLGTIASFPTIGPPFPILVNVEISVVFCLTDSNINLRTYTGHICTESAIVTMYETPKIECCWQWLVHPSENTKQSHIMLQLGVAKWWQRPGNEGKLAKQKLEVGKALGCLGTNNLLGLQ